MLLKNGSGLMGLKRQGCPLDFKAEELLRMTFCIFLVNNLGTQMELTVEHVEHTITN